MFVYAVYTPNTSLIDGPYIFRSDIYRRTHLGYIYRYTVITNNLFIYGNHRYVSGDVKLAIFIIMIVKCVK